MGAVLIKFLVRILTYLFGLLVVVVLVSMAAFVIARPQIDEFVTTEIKKRGLNVESWDLGLNGRANLRAAHMSLPEGIEIKAALISARPPLAGFPGVATIQDLRIDRGDINLTIPELEISGISQYEKKTDITNKMRQLLHQFAIDWVRADSISLSLDGNSDDSLKLETLVLEGIRQGKIDRLTVTEIGGQLEDARQHGSPGGLLHLGAIDARDIDIEAALSYLTGQKTPSKQSANDEAVTIPIIGASRLSDLRFEAEIAAKPMTLKFGSLTSQGISLQKSDNVPLDIIRNFALTQRKAASPQEKRQSTQKLLSLLGGINTLDARLDNMELTIPTAKLDLQSLTLHSSDWAALIPERLEVTLAGLVLDMTDPPENIAPVLSATGYNKIEVTATLRIRWDETQHRLEMEDLSLAAKDVGDFSLKLQIDNIDGLLFASSGQEEGSWLQKLRLHDFDMGIRDRGAVANFTTIIADIGGVEAEEIHQGLEEMARRAPLILFEDEILAENATQAMLAFLRQSGLLRLHVSSKEETGLAFEQLMGEAVDWPTLLSLAQIRFTHEALAASSNQDLIEN